MSPAEKLRWARKTMARLHGVDEKALSNVETSLDQEGNLVVRGDVIVPGTVASIECDVKIDWDGKP